MSKYLFCKSILYAYILRIKLFSGKEMLSRKVSESYLKAGVANTFYLY